MPPDRRLQKQVGRRVGGNAPCAAGQAASKRTVVLASGVTMCAAGQAASKKKDWSMPLDNLVCRRVGGFKMVKSCIATTEGVCRRVGGFKK